MAKDVMSDEFAASSVSSVALIIGFIFAFLAGLVACKWMIALVKKAKLTYFAIYCSVIGVAAIIYSLNQ